MNTPARLTTALADRYRIERELGQGGMATVYLARDLKHDREVAFKVLKPELAAILGRERFLNEIRLTARLDHPHILTLIDSGESDGFFWYVTPYIRGESLRARLTRERQLGIEEALAITRQIAGALGYSHQRGVIHRDIKPENILLHEGEAVLADFGIALAVKEAGGNRLTETGLSLGTPLYMSPEQATGDRELDARSDLYSLGAVLYEMLAGEPPHTGPTVQSIIAKLMTERPTRIRTVRDTVPESVDAAVARALAKIPADRFPSAASFVAALDQHPVQSEVRRRRLTRPVLVTIALVLTLGAMAALVFGRSRQPVMYQPVQLTSTGRASIPVLSPDGSQVAYTDQFCDEEEHCRSNLVIREAASGEEHTILANLDFGGIYRWSPNGLWLLAYLQERGQPARIAVLSRMGERLRELGGLVPVDFVAGDTVALLAALTPRNGIVPLRLVAATSARAYDTLELQAPTVSRSTLGQGLLVSPDARWIVVMWQTQAGYIVTLHDRSGRLRDSMDLGSWSENLRWDPRSRGLLSTLPASATSGTTFARVAVDPKRGRFGRRDSIPVTSTNNADAGFDFSQDGRTVVMASSEQGTFDLWAAERRDTAFVPVRRLQRSSMRPGRRGYISPDGKNVLYNLPQGSVAGSSSFRTVAFDGGPERVIMTLSTPWSGFVAGLDGRFLYIGERSESGGTRVMAYPIAGGPSLPVVELPDSGHHLVAGPGGGVGVINRAGDSLRFYAATGALLRVLSLPRTTGLTQLIPSPDGNAFAFPGNEVQMGEDGDFEQEFLRLDAVTGDVRPLVRVGYLSYFVGLAGWNAEGLVLGLFRNGEPEFSLFSVPFDGGPPVRLASLPFGGRAGCTLSADITRMACLVSHPVTDLHLIRDFDGLR